MKILAKNKVKFHLNCIKDNIGKSPVFDIECIEKTINACNGDLNVIIDTTKLPYKMEQKFNDDKNLLTKFALAKRITDCEFEKLDNPELKQFVLDYLNSRLPIIYSPENEPDNSWNRKSPMTFKGLFDGGGVEIKEAPDGEKCHIFYFDCDSYRFEGWLYVTDDRRAFFTDWDGNAERRDEIAKFLE